ncbi:methionine--tRNA ligase [Candidatus Uhrbacteria bacterium RIFOXYB12_FULL_58_10]|uniref:Methionine--tRNA ligase n=1 Tax=Candidatus Uhrbacteria bacterium RIFOXYB2_FULL_57_15 TaxID=1802422 RepID=A0A1F7W929_9BACT|nr:MAG: methionine--tRNA ligase [Candidatus Uhrbacteria bacterium RIFOXYB12_FULL_58_10]OGL99312.1 MAG: methionine--tRNA ligase [Candidatus Uhrbacteria bacterium RIFOXYB2_FULL_57_15]OGM00523.1 MAG: methionine--tRNA ligase [Candidatus Uhrbacteria bacterium RIFOXYC12_FULL_57_11]
MQKKFYVSTPIYYINGKPSIGHAYTTIIADVLARYHRMLGERVLFLTGTDENSQKNVEAAAAVGKAGDIQGYLDEMAAIWERTWDSLGLTHDRFIRTTEPAHRSAVGTFWKAVEANGDIYQGAYEGLYCKGCEAFYSEADLVEGKCPLHKTAPETIKEKNYFFRLTKYRDVLLEHIGKHPEFIRPESRRNEVLSYVRDFMTDISITRSSMKWGIPVPGDESQRIYVWFDALINYLTGAGYPDANDWWPCDLHLVGKDIIKFHCALWPAMLLSAGLPLPASVFAHGFFTVNGDKMSKSLGNVIDPVDIANQYDNDTLRFFLIREIMLGGDGDFSEARLKERYNGELANELGNLVQRVLSMTEKYFDGRIPERAEGFLAGAWPAYRLAMDEVRLNDALDVVWSLVRQANQYVESQAPWKLAKLGEDKMLADTMYVLLETLRHIAWMLLPFMPLTSKRILQSLNLTVADEFSQSAESAWVWGELTPGGTIKKGEALFPRKE